jgi:hypothetical protein
MKTTKVRYGVRPEARNAVEIERRILPYCRNAIFGSIERRFSAQNWVHAALNTMPIGTPERAFPK